MAQEYVDRYALEVVADARGGGEEIYLTNDCGDLYGDTRNLFDLFPAGEWEQAQLGRHAAYSKEFRLFFPGGVPMIAVCIGYAVTHMIPVIVPRGEAARLWANVRDGGRLDWHLSVVGSTGEAAEPTATPSEIYHGTHELLSRLNRGYFYKERLDMAPHVVAHVLTVRAAAMAKLFGCRMRVQVYDGFGFATMPDANYDWCSGVLAALCHAAVRAGADQTVDLFFDRPQTHLPVCHALIKLKDPDDALPEFAVWRSAAACCLYFACRRLADCPDVAHITFSLAAREISVQGVRADLPYRSGIVTPASPADEE